MEQDCFRTRGSLYLFRKQNRREQELLKPGLARINNLGIGLDSVPRFAFCNKFMKMPGASPGRKLLLYNVHMSETKAVRLTETVKAAG
jgi:hypothetical protein